MTVRATSATVRKDDSCSVVISTRDRPELLAECLRSVREQGAVREIIVVDSAPRNAATEGVAALSGARYLRVDRPGLSRARNAGGRAAVGEIIVFLDDDVTLEPGCIDGLLREFGDPRVVAAGGRILLVDGDDAARRAFEAFGGFDAGTERRVVDRDTPHWFELTNFGGLGSGALFALRRCAFDSWPGFDERLGRGAGLDGGEELYAYFTLVDAGHRVVFTPAAAARHPAPASLGELRRRLLSAAAVGSAYLALLFVEHPRYRGEAIRYAWGTLCGRHRDWRPRPAASRRQVVANWRMRLAWICGPMLYARLRAAGLRRAAQ
jgi:glycosyltransferase involved in cell wall biosynthesis